MKYKAAIFDMDGTILNTLDDLADSVNFSLNEFGLPNRRVEEIRGFLGNGLKELVKRAVPDDTSEDELDRICSFFESYYKEHCAIKTRPYPGINDAIYKIKNAGIFTAVVSNKIDSAVKELCDKYFTGLFDYSVGDRPGKRRKPYPDSVEIALHFLGISKEEAVYIGDSEVDLNTAKNAGTDLIMVDWGFRDESFLRMQGAQIIVHSPAELTDLILL